MELPSFKPRLVRHHQGLRKLSPDLIGKARDETATQVTRVGLSFLSVTAFCFLSLLNSPDAALLGGNEKINMPLAGPVSFLGFMLLGPAVLILLRVYLQIYVEHGDRLDRLARSVSAVRAPTLVPLENSLMRIVSGLIFYALLPVAMMLFALKAAVFPRWGLALFSVAAAVLSSHALLLSSRLSWRSNVLTSVSVAIIAGIIFAFVPLHRPFNLFRANLSDQWLPGENLSKANLSEANLLKANLLKANLSGANLSGANLSGAYLRNANLSGADLSGANLSGARLLDANLSGARLPDANLSGAHLSGSDLLNADLFNTNLSGARLFNTNLSGARLFDANLTGADLFNANLSDANLSGANLIDAKFLDQTQLDKACGKAKLPEGLKLKPCPPPPLPCPVARCFILED